MKPGVLLSLAVSVMLTTAPVRAEGPAPFPDFTFKRISPPKPGQKRITVQIDPAEQQAALKKPVVAELPVAAKPVAGRFGWFWETVSPDVAQGNALRLDSALEALGHPPAGQAVAAPRLKDMLPIVRDQGRAMLVSTIGTKVSPALVLAVMMVESGGRADAVSSAGAEGLMQLIPATAERFGVDDSLNADENIRGGVAYLDWLLGSPEKHPKRWRERTPLFHADRITAPMIFFQGGQDKVVVPEQTRAMAEAMKAAGRAPELHWFEDEGHGFRRQANQAGMLEWMFSFYRKHSQKANDHAENLS